MSNNIQEKVAVSTGASSGLGEETAFAQAVAFAMNQPDEVDVNEILFRPARQQLQGSACFAI
jgi:NADP-dependent 3-hydroxy acid dehydrogenase YdfG